MSREHSFLRILAANAKIQMHVSYILESKAKELEKSRNWTCRHMLDTAFGDHDSQLKESLKVHEQLIEVIDGITKVENGLARNLKLLVGQDESGGGLDGDSGIGLGGMFDFGGDMK